MKIVITDGCTCSGITVDDTNITDLAPEQRKEVWDKVCEALKGGNDEELSQLIWWINSSFAFPKIEPKHLFHCEQCGDDVYEKTLEL